MTTTKKAAKKTIASKPSSPANDQTLAPKKAKQLSLAGEGMQRKKIAEVDKAAEAFREARDTRMKHTKVEKEKKTVLMDVAKKHGLKNGYVYESEDGEEFVVDYTEDSKANVKVRKLERDDGDDE